MGRNSEATSPMPGIYSITNAANGKVYVGCATSICRRIANHRRELRKGEDSFGEWVAEKGGPQASRVKKLLYEDPDPDDDHRLLAACDNDKATYERVRPFAGLLRRDLRALPAVFTPGSLYVTQTSLRRDSGTAYTTKELADWRGNRADAGRIAPKGFPRTNRFNGS